MSTAPPLLTCPACQTTLGPNGACPQCPGPEGWNDQIGAVDFVLRRVQDWHQSGQLTDRQRQALTELYEQRKKAMQDAANAKQPFQRDATFPPGDICWSCKAPVAANASHCSECGAVSANPGVRSLRYWRYLYRELMAHEESGQLNLRQAHELLADTKERLASLRGKLDRERAPQAVLVDEAPPREPSLAYRDGASVGHEAQGGAAAGPRRSMLEILLDPHSIQWLLGAGGALIVLGLVIWLSNLGLFQDKGFVAILLGLGNLALLGGGWALLLKTRYQTGGQALTLLACLVMPLNLWFHDANGIMKLHDNLWIGALVCCVIYTASAWVLKDALLVYVLVGGVTLTGLLLLGQLDIFDQIAPSSTVLIILGLICLHAERAFPDIDSPFSRRQFGMAFFWSAQALMAAGLLMLLGAQLVGWAHVPLAFQHVPDVAKKEFLTWTLALVLAGTYSYVYSDLVVRRIGVYIYLAAITILWAEVHILILTDLAESQAVVIITLALTALAVNVLATLLKEQHAFLRAVPPLGILLSMIPVAYGVLLHFRAVSVVLHRDWPFTISWEYVGAMAVTAVCCRAGAFLYRHSLKDVSVAYFFATAAATLVFAAGLTWMIDLKPWETEAPLVMIVPILYLVASYLYRGHSAEEPLIWVAHASVGIMIVCSALVALKVTPQVNEVVPLEPDMRHLLLAVFCLQGALFYGVAAFLRRTNWTIYLATAMLCGALWQLLTYFHTPAEYFTVVFASIGFVLLVLYRFGVFEKWEMPGLERAVFQSANALTTLGFAAGALLALSRLTLREDAGGEWRQPVRIVLFLLIFLATISLLSAWLVQHQVWRRVHLVLTIINAIALILVFHKLSNLNPWQRLELFTVILGTVLLIASFVGWYRESERASDLVSFGFFFGSLGVVVPLLTATIIYRLHPPHEPGLDDLGLVASSIVLFGSGILCRIKATTLIGAAGMFLYLLVILVALHWNLPPGLRVGIYLTLGGALLFGTGLFLSMYRDRLLLLPAKIRRREGVFRIFDWR